MWTSILHCQEIHCSNPTTTLKHTYTKIHTHILPNIMGLQTHAERHEKWFSLYMVVPLQKSLHLTSQRGCAVLLFQSSLCSSYSSLCFCCGCVSVREDERMMSVHCQLIQLNFFFVLFFCFISGCIAGDRYHQRVCWSHERTLSRICRHR